VYNADVPGIAVAFPPAAVTPLAEIIASAGLRQLHVAETEKYAHVTYFFNGRVETPFTGEERILPPHPSYFVCTVEAMPLDRSVEFLAIASGSAVTGAAIMAAFVLGTAPLFAVLGYAARRSATMLRGQLAKVAAVAVVVTGLLSINAGLVLSGSNTTLATMWASVADRQAPNAAPGDAAAVAAAPSEDGVQRIVVTVGDAGYSPAVVRVRAGVPTQLTFRTDGTQGCTRSLVVPSLKVGRQLPATGDTTLDLGQLAAGRLRYTCGMGMYSGTVEAT